MHGVMTKEDEARVRVRQYLQQCYRDSLPLLDKSIRLAIPELTDAHAITRYYEKKHRRCGESEYFLHHVRAHGGRTEKMKWRGWI